MSIVVPIPYTLVIFWLGQAGWDPIMLMISGGAGSAIGELAGYFLGYYGRRLVSEERQKKMDYLLRVLGKYSPAAIFLFGDRKIAAKENIVDVRLSADSATEEYVLGFLKKVMVGLKETVLLGDKPVIEVSRRCRTCGETFELIGSETECPVCRGVE